ncbi:lysozyme inhibitor LprI family protein [Azospirillum isscasi]|uniref:Lysozyme inhibitor LprI family protein n=1 Tax=Azospirillum isscasi TaxID=3053926 RepID=A0ABU0WCV6_9PROT|nr:lysozyme inhibitor LprI family protein [Azospirillum isscasi]MDQ2102018.1 lysozyme inhibitor LprI family protein [Azospirillum isscasi]
MRAAILLTGMLMAGTAMAADTGGETAKPMDKPAAMPMECAGETPAAQLICRDVSLVAASGKLDSALQALADEAGKPGAEAVAAGQRAWLQRRDAACPVADADLADPKKGKDRAACLARQMADRTRALDSELAARRAPVADEPLTVSASAPPRPAPAPAKAGPAKRAAGLPDLTGRWAKADPATRAPIDDCRTSYLEIAGDGAFSLHDPRIPGFPLEGPLAPGEGDPAEGLSFGGEEGLPEGTLRLDAAEAPRLDRLFLKLAQPAFGATFVRCR